MSNHFRIQVPATSANLGVGFDRLGIALQFYNYFEAKPSECLSVKINPANCVETFEMDLTPENNLLAQAYQAFFKHFSLPLVNAELTIEAHIPFSRGLGSSSTAIVAGVYLANLMSGSTKTKQQLLPLIIELEGHPDNVVPAMLGGLQDCTSNTEHHQLDWPKDWGLMFVIPPNPLSTKQARSVLPKTYPKEDLEKAKQNISQWLKAVKTSDLKLLKTVLMTDIIHEPYRKTLIPEYDIVARAIKNTPAIGVVISGAGSTLLVVTSSNESIAEVKIHLKNVPELAHCKIIHLQPDVEGTKLQTKN